MIRNTIVTQDLVILLGCRIGSDRDADLALGATVTKKRPFHRCLARWRWHEDGNQQDLPVLAIEMSTHAQGHRLRRVRRCLANTTTAVSPSPGQDKIGTRKG